MYRAYSFFQEKNEREMTQIVPTSITGWSCKGHKIINEEIRVDGQLIESLLHL